MTANSCFLDPFGSCSQFSQQPTWSVPRQFHLARHGFARKDLEVVADFQQLCWHVFHLNVSRIRLV